MYSSATKKAVGYSRSRKPSVHRLTVKAWQGRTVTEYAKSRKIIVLPEKARNDMCIEVINGMADTIAEIEKKIEFICEQLARDFEIPCNFSPMDEIMLEDGRCEKDCGEIPESECWKRYFEVMQRRAESEE